MNPNQIPQLSDDILAASYLPQLPPELQSRADQELAAIYEALWEHIASKGPRHSPPPGSRTGVGNRTVRSPAQRRGVNIQCEDAS